MIISFALGIIVGVAISILIVIIETYFKPTSILKLIEQKTQALAKKESGAIIDVPDELEEARQNVIDRNVKSGRITRIDELQ